jgi:frataxin-like iron-binding protein CyaY
MNMSERDRVMWIVASGEANGGHFDYKRMEWEEPEV